MSRDFAVYNFVLSCSRGIKYPCFTIRYIDMNKLNSVLKTIQVFLLGDPNYQHW